MIFEVSNVQTASHSQSNRFALSKQAMYGSSRSPDWNSACRRHCKCFAGLMWCCFLLMHNPVLLLAQQRLEQQPDCITSGSLRLSKLSVSSICLIRRRKLNQKFRNYIFNFASHSQEGALLYDLDAVDFPVCHLFGANKTKKL